MPPSVAFLRYVRELPRCVLPHCASLRCNHPKQADFYMTFLLVNFAVKNAMFNLNENNRFVMAQHPNDMRIGVNGMCGQVRAVGPDFINAPPKLRFTVR